MCYPSTHCLTKQILVPPEKTTHRQIHVRVEIYEYYNNRVSYSVSFFSRILFRGVIFNYYQPFSPKLYDRNNIKISLHIITIKNSHYSNPLSINLKVRWKKLILHFINFCKLKITKIISLLTAYAYFNNYFIIFNANQDVGFSTSY